MIEREMPKVGSVDVIAVQPKSSDVEKMNFRNEAAPAAAVVPVQTFVVKIELSDSPLLHSGNGLLVFVGDHPIEKYTGYKDGIYFKVYDPEFFQLHAGEEIRLSADDGATFVSTGKTLPGEPANMESLAPGDDQLPTQEQVLSGITAES